MCDTHVVVCPFLNADTAQLFYKANEKAILIGARQTVDIKKEHTVLQDARLLWWWRFLLESRWMRRCLMPADFLR
jgi:hypothetical protein